MTTVFGRIIIVCFYFFFFRETWSRIVIEQKGKGTRQARKAMWIVTKLQLNQISQKKCTLLRDTMNYIFSPNNTKPIEENMIPISKYIFNNWVFGINV